MASVWTWQKPYVKPNFEVLQELKTGGLTTFFNHSKRKQHFYILWLIHKVGVSQSKYNTSTKLRYIVREYDNTIMQFEKEISRYPKAEQTFEYTRKLKSCFTVY